MPATAPAARAAATRTTGAAISELPALHFLEQPLGLLRLLGRPLAQGGIVLGRLLVFGRLDLRGVLLGQRGDPFVIGTGHGVSWWNGPTTGGPDAPKLSGGRAARASARGCAA